MAKHRRKRQRSRRVSHRASRRHVRRTRGRVRVICDGTQVYSGASKMATVVAKASSKVAGTCTAVVGGRAARWGKAFWKKSPAELEAKAGKIVASYAHGKRSKRS